MDDGLAEKLFNAFWDPIVARGWPLPCAWSDLHPTQREAWQRVATEASEDAAKKQGDETAMLRSANAAWRKQFADLRPGIEILADLVYDHSSDPDPRRRVSVCVEKPYMEPDEVDPVLAVLAWLRASKEADKAAGG